MVVVVAVTLVSFSAVLLMSPMIGNSMQVYFNSTLNLAQFISHALLSIPAIILGVWLVALWRPESMSFAIKSRRIAQLMLAFWVPSYVVGVVDFLLLHTTILG